MKLHPEDPRLTAYVLGELAVEEAAAVEGAAGEDPAIEAEIREIRTLQQFLTDRLAAPQGSLLPNQREAILRTAREADRAGKILSFTAACNALKPWLIPASAAAVLALSTVILLRMPGARKPAPIADKKPAPAQVTPAPAAPDNKPAPPPAPLVAPLMPRGSMIAAESPTLELPVLTGKAGLEQISKSIRGENKLPPRESVRLEEVLNAFPLRLNGVTAISRSGSNSWHPDNRDSGVSAHVATLSTEMIACPWKPSATLLIVSLRGNAQQDCDVKVSFRTNPGTISRYRLLGFNTPGGPADGKLPSKLAANSNATFVIEIEPSRPRGELGALEWSTDDKAAPSISLVHKPDTEPSDDARFAALVCTYSQWLAGEQAGIIDADIVAALAREIASTTLPADRADFLNLIDRSLHF